MNAPTKLPPIIQAIDRVWSTVLDKPLRPWGSALSPVARQEIITPTLIGPTAKPYRLGPCKVCGERRFWCEHTAPQENERTTDERRD